MKDKKQNRILWEERLFRKYGTSCLADIAVISVMQARRGNNAETVDCIHNPRL